MTCVRLSLHLLLMLVLGACTGRPLQHEATPVPPEVEPLEAIPAAVVEEWQTVDVMLQPPSGSTTPSQRLFSVQLPDGWQVNHPRIGADSWSGSFEGDDVRLRISGGGYSVSSIYRVVEGGPIPYEPETAALHLVTEEVSNGIDMTLVRPRRGVDGLTGVLFEKPRGARGKATILGIDLTQEQQAIAFAIFRSIEP